MGRMVLWVRDTAGGSAAVLFLSFCRPSGARAVPAPFYAVRRRDAALSLPSAVRSFLPVTAELCHILIVRSRSPLSFGSPFPFWREGGWGVRSG